MARPKLLLLAPNVNATRATAQRNTMSNDSNTTSDHEHVNISSDYIPRYTGPAVQDMTREQCEIRDEILASRPRTGLNGPFGPWLAIPGIARPAEALGRACRYGTSLSFRESELVILLTGAKTQCATEFDIHVGEALQAGLSMDIIAAIPRKDQFSMSAVAEQLIPLLLQLNNHPREVAIVQFTTELLDTCTVSDATYQATKAALDGQDSVLVEITSIVGYYTFVCYTLNVFHIPSAAQPSPSIS